MAALKKQVADKHHTCKSKWAEECCCTCLEEAALCNVYNENITLLNSIILRNTAKDRIHQNYLDTGPVKEGKNNSNWKISFSAEFSFSKVNLKIRLCSAYSLLMTSPCCLFTYPSVNNPLRDYLAICLYIAPNFS